MPIACLSFLFPPFFFHEREKERELTHHLNTMLLTKLQVCHRIFEFSNIITSLPPGFWVFWHNYKYATGFSLFFRKLISHVVLFEKENTENVVLVFSKITHFHFHFLENAFHFLHPNTFSYIFSFSMKMKTENTQNFHEPNTA